MIKVKLEYDLDNDKDTILMMLNAIDYACTLHQIRERLYQYKKNYCELSEREEGIVNEVIQMVGDAPMEYLK